MSEIDFELDMDDELPPVRTFIDGELVNIDADMQAMTPIIQSAERSDISPINQSTERSVLSTGSLDSADESVAAGLGISLAGSVAACVERAVAAQNTAAALVLEAGYLMLKAKAECERGEFLKLLKAHGVTQQTASDLMLTAKFYTSLDPEKRKQVFMLSKTKLRALAAADPEVVQDLLEDPDNELKSLSVRDLRDTIRQQEAEYKILRQQHETLRREHNNLTKAKQPGEGIYNARTVEVRHEAAALEYASRVNVDALDVIYGEVINDSETSHQERELQLHAIAIAAGGLLARAELLYARIKDDLGDLLPIKTNANYLLRDDEKARLQDSVTMIDINFTRAKNKRDIERSAERPGPGRKKGSSNKKGGEDV
jgi:hypothetical protein